VTANQLPESIPHRPLATFIDATERTVHDVRGFDDPMKVYKVIARTSGHLAAMWRAVYPHVDGQPGPDGQLRAVCLSRARDVEWTLHLLQCHMAGEASAVGRSATAVLTVLTQRLDHYRSAERALVAWLEDHLATERRDELARKYRRALTRAPTRPHPRSPRAGPMAGVAFFLHGRWDRFLDEVDSRPGVGRDFLVPLPDRGGPPAA
jgi:hypothetical protein